MSIIHPAELFDMTQPGFGGLGMPEGESLNIVEGMAHRNLGLIEPKGRNRVSHYGDSTLAGERGNLVTPPNGLELSRPDALGSPSPTLRPIQRHVWLPLFASGPGRLQRVVRLR